jgi:hypothetical protein
VAREAPECSPKKYRFLASKQVSRQDYTVDGQDSSIGVDQRSTGNRS